MKVALFCTKFIGRGVLEFLLNNHVKDLSAIVFLDQDKEILNEFSIPKDIDVFEYSELKSKDSDYFSLELDLVIVAWFPKIIPSDYYDFARLGAINTHNSLLPIGRGVHANYWAIKNTEPYGVSIHRVTDDTDAGDLVIQKSIEYTWEDDGETIYWKGLELILELFKQNYSNLEQLIENAKPQNLDEGSLYYLRDMEGSFELLLDKDDTPRNILNSIRAKQFSNGGACFFIDNNQKYEVRVNIKKYEED